MLKPFSLFFFAGALLSAAPGVRAQQATITHLGNTPKGATLNFPVVGLPDKAVARKINDYLQIHVLRQTTLKAPGGQVFDKVKWTENRSGIDAIDYTIQVNNANLLSIGFDYEYMAAYPSGNQEYYTFNAQNGEIVFVTDLFTPQGLTDLSAEIKRKRSDLIAAHLKELKNNPDAAESLDEIKNSLNDCNGEAHADNFCVTATGIIFHSVSCLPHVIASLDADLDITYSFAQLRPYLSVFGQKLLNPAKQAIANDSFPSLQKPLRGKIDNKYDIVVQLHFYGDHSVDGFYYYNNYQSAIELSGKIEKDVLELKERDKDDNDAAVFTGTIHGTTISGTWTNLKTKKTMGFEVKN